MNDRMLSRPALPVVRRFTAGVSVALTATALLTSGCGGKDTFARINGQVVTKDEYIKALERQSVAVPGGGQPTNAERLVLDTLVGNKVILAEAAKANALPSEEDVNRYYDLQKKLYEQQFPGKKWEDSMQDSGTTPEEVKSDIRVQLAETNLYAKEMNVGDAEVRKAYEGAHGAIGLPPRVQFRLIVVPPNSPDFQKAKQALASPSADFDAIAKEVNLTPALRAIGGLQPQVTPIKSIGAVFQSRVDQTPEGKWFGPVPYSIAPNSPNIPTMQAWVKVEKKLQGYTVSYEDAAPLVRRQMVQNMIMLPQNAAIRAGIMGEKLKSTFEPSDPRYKTVWDGVKKAAEDAGAGKMPAAAAPAPNAMGAPAAALGATAPGSPAAAPK